MAAASNTKDTKKKLRGASLKVQQHLLAKFTPGSWLPSEVELAESFGVTRYAVTRALNNLSSLGIVRREAGRGTIFIGAGDEETGKSAATVALISPEFTTGLLLGLLPFLEKRFGERDIRLALRSTEHRGNLELARLGELKQGGFAGAIITPDDVAGERQQLRLLAEAGFPLVMLDRPLRDVPAGSVCTDHYQGARKVVGHLLALGHRRIAHITYAGDFHKSHGVLLRHRGYLDELEAVGVKPAGDLVETVRLPTGHISPDTRGDSMSAYIATHKLLSREKPPTAVFVVNDHLCHGVIQAARNHGLRVPGDFSVAGFDNDSVLFPRDLPLTTYAHPLEKIADSLFELLCAKMENPRAKARQIIIPGNLVPGASTAAVPR